MDTKLKNKSISFNLLVLVISINILIITGFLGITRYYYSKSVIAIGYMIGISIILSLLVGIFIINKKYKLEYRNNIVDLFYSKLFIEIRILFIFIAMNLIAYLHEISNYRDFFSYDYISGFFICLLLIYVAICDAYKMGLINKKEELDKYIKDKSLIYFIHNKTRSGYSKICNEFNGNLIIKSTKNRLLLKIVYIFLYVLVLLITAHHIGYHYIRWYDIFSMNIEEIFLIFISFLLTAVLLVYVFTFECDINYVQTAVGSILSGKYNNEASLSKVKIFKQIAYDIKNIENGLNKVIEEAVRSERMKGELITNVSHDLKTPLTSIINYIDFLDKEDISEEEKKKYISILKERSNRLKVLIEDLFEVSKASSGNMELNMENIDLIALIRQTLGEFEEKIEKSTLSFIKEIPYDKVIIYADGKKTFRVFQNIISNILKYSMDHSRVYINVSEEEEFVCIVFRNISKYRLNMNEEEILERFKRGDSSRTTEGSGLGLAIAKSLIELQGGKFEVIIDGDLFKVRIMIRKENKINLIN